MPQRATAAFETGPRWGHSEGPLIGLEHEYYLSSAGNRIDFRRLIHRLPLDGRRIDPSDAAAYRLRSGLALTADDSEAEIASPPEPLTSGFASRIEAWAREGRRTLRTLLPPAIEMDGASTHISVSTDDRWTGASAELFTRRFTPGYMLLAERDDSFGIMVRPRNGRLELCSEYVDGVRLRAASAFAAGASLACARAAATGDLYRLPPVVDVRLRPCTDRAGVIVRRNAFGPDLYEQGSSALLVRPGGATITAGDHLALSWEAARVALADAGVADDLVEAEAILSGRLPLGFEQRSGDEAFNPCVTVPVAAAADGDFAVFAIHRPGRCIYACVPRAQQARFLEELDHGELDRLLEARLARAGGRDVLGAYPQTRRFGLYDRLGRTSALLTPERGDPRRITPGTTGTSREFQDVVGAASGLAKIPTDGGSGIPGWLWGVVIGILMLIGGGITTLLLLGGGSTSDEEPGRPVVPDGGVVETPTDTPTPARAEPSPTTGTSASPTTGSSESPTTGTSESPTTGAVANPTTGIASTPTPTTGAVSDGGGIASTPTPTPTSTSLPAVLSGNRTVTFMVSANPASHPCGVGPTLEVRFFITRAGPPEAGTPITFEVTGTGFPPMTGSTVFGPGFNSQGGTGTVSGTGPYCGFTTSYKLTFTITPLAVFGTLVIGGDGALPMGQPITFSFSGGLPH